MANDWHYSKNGKRFGPVSGQQLKELAAKGELAPTDLVWKEGMKEWMPASKIKGLLPNSSAVTKTPSPVSATAPTKTASSGPPKNGEDLSTRTKVVLFAGVGIVGLCLVSVILAVAGWAFFGKKSGPVIQPIAAADAKKKLPGDLPPADDPEFINRQDGIPCRSWAWQHQIAIAAQGVSDARTAAEWSQVQRRLKSNVKALHGVSDQPVFALHQTVGKVMTSVDDSVRRWIESLPLYCVAKAWGLSVEAFNGCAESLKGSYFPRGGIALGVTNLVVWAHELVHAADHRVHQCLGERWEEEVVAGLGGGALLIAIGLPERADLGGCFDHIQKHVKDRGTTVLEACQNHRQRTASSMNAILQAEALNREAHQ